MMKRIPFIFVLILLLLTGCRPFAFLGQSVIDWIDFINFDGKQYIGIDSGVLADEKYVGEKIGAVKFKVADNVKNPSYKSRDGDAAFHEKGTEIFQVKDQPHLIAVKNTEAINGYRVYFSSDDVSYQWRFKDMPLERVELIEIYRVDLHKDKLISVLTNDEDVSNLLQLLVESDESPGFQPRVHNMDSIIYQMIFYTGEPIAYKYNMFFDGVTYYWHPWDTATLSDEINMFVNEN